VWLPLAQALKAAAQQYGLKFDPQVTCNPAGILRVPSSYNYKKAQQPTQVYLYGMDDGWHYPTYSFQQIAHILQNFHKPTASARQPNQYSSQRNANFGALAVTTAPPVPIEDLAINCGVFSDILGRAGAGDPEPLWNMALYAASFTTDPIDAAHKLSSGDSRYTQAGTDKKIQEKINARAANPAAGWPTCAQYSALHPACATCPFASQAKTPFHFVPKPQVAPHPQTQVHTNFMPPDYWLGQDHHVYTEVTDKAGNISIAMVINYPVFDAAIDEGSGALAIKTRIGGVYRWVHAMLGHNPQPASIIAGLFKEQMYVRAYNNSYDKARNFLVAWLAHLQTIKRTITAVNYGWTNDGKGFTFGESTYYPTGPVEAFQGDEQEIAPRVMLHAERRPSGRSHQLQKVSGSQVANEDLPEGLIERVAREAFDVRDGIAAHLADKRRGERLRDGVFTTYSTTEGLPSDAMGPVHVDGAGRAERPGE